MKYLVAVKVCHEGPSVFKAGSRFPAGFGKFLCDSVDTAIQKHFEVFSRIDTPFGDPFYFMVNLNQFLLYSVERDEGCDTYIISSIVPLDTVDIQSFGKD